MKQTTILFLMLCAIILISVSSCEDVKKPEAPKPTTPVPATTEPGPKALCKRLEKPRYSDQFSDLVCALRASKQNPKLKPIVLAQWILESGRGNSKLASKFLNFGGLKWREEMKAYGSPISYEAWDGRTSYIQFKSVEDFITGYWHFIDRYPYRGWDNYKEDPAGYIKFINHAGYTPPKDYYKRVLQLQDEAAGLLEKL